MTPDELIAQLSMMNNSPQILQAQDAIRGSGADINALAAQLNPPQPPPMVAPDTPLKDQRQSVFSPDAPKRGGFLGFVERIGNNPLIDRFSAGLNHPLAQMGFNMMAQSSVPGQTFAGGFGRAGVNTMQNMQRQRFLEAQLQAMGLNSAAALLNASREKNSALTDLGKAYQDFLRGNITQEEFDLIRDSKFSESVQGGFEREQTLRKEFSDVTKDLDKSLDAVSQVLTLMESGNPIANMAGFVSLIKSIDNSTVREGELRNFASVNGLLNEINQWVVRNTNPDGTAKGAFTEPVRMQIIDAAQKIRKNLERMHGKYTSFYNHRAEKFNVDPIGVTGRAISTSGLPRTTRTEGSNRGNTVGATYYDVLEDGTIVRRPSSPPEGR